MKKMMVVLAAVAALAAFGQGLQTVKLSAVTNILNLPVVPGKCGSFMSVNPPAAGLPAGPLSVSDILVEVDTGRIVGGMGSYVYPTIEEGAFAMTNTIVRALIDKHGAGAMCMPQHVVKNEGCMEMTCRWKPDPKAKEELELVVRAYANKKRQLAICTCLHTKGDSIRCGLIAPLK